MQENRISVDLVVAGAGDRRAVDLLAGETGLSKARIKDAMTKGALWVQAPGRGRSRVRRATWCPPAGTRLELRYDPEILARVAPEASCLADRGRFSLWAKPAGLLTQGTEWGDHCALLRRAEIAFTPVRRAWPVHRLDREVAGLVLVAHDREAAGRLSTMLGAGEITKSYRARVAGRPRPVGEGARLAGDLDGRPAVTEYTVVEYCAEEDTSLLEVRIGTGRLHQIRRHLADAGHPVMGDRRYGGRGDGRGFGLIAHRIALTDPFTGEELDYSYSQVR